jgi:hypothetical protein
MARLEDIGDWLINEALNLRDRPLANFIYTVDHLSYCSDIPFWVASTFAKTKVFQARL